MVARPTRTVTGRLFWDDQRLPPQWVLRIDVVDGSSRYTPLGYDRNHLRTAIAHALQLVDELDDVVEGSTPGEVLDRVSTYT